MTDAREFNLDGLVGPTHNYAGLAAGNLASQRNRGLVSNPREAALQGLEKMKMLMDLGIGQAVLPPLERPDITTLRRVGFLGSDADVLAAAARDAPSLLAACCSASSMWAANAATVSPSADTGDGRVHITPANLVSHLHRSLEAAGMAAIFRAIFRDSERFALHDSLPPLPILSDEGAANHTRLCTAHDGPGLELFVYGRGGFDESTVPLRFPARQTCAASAAVARLHRLRPEAAMLIRQNPAAIDAGVFHNDVIAVGNQHVLLCHEGAFADPAATIDTIRRRFKEVCGGEIETVVIPARLLSLEQAVASYLFNSQVVTRPDGSMCMVAPFECQQIGPAADAIAHILATSGSIRDVRYVDLRQSMRNGGGPACLRLRVVLHEDERCHPGVVLTPALYRALAEWIGRHYRERLGPQDLVDPQLLAESRAALAELTSILGLGAIYGFQHG